MQRRSRISMLLSFPLLFGSLLSFRSTLAADLPPAIVPQGFGVNIHFTDPQPGEMDRFHEAGFGVARMDFAWEGVEKTPGVYDFSAYDRLYVTLAAAGTRPLFILDYGNKLYDQGPPRKPSARAAFARFAAAAVRHFAGKNVIWEIWNEPNGDGFWPPHADASEYAAMALEAAKAIRTADPKCTLIAPGAAGFPWEYLETVFKSGLLQYLDGVSVHPYRGGAPESAAADWARLRGLIGRYAPPDKRQMPMISSEWGYSTKQGGDISPEKQGQYITREWLANLASGVDLSIYYDWKEDGTDPKENEDHFGTVRPDLAPKPAFTAARSLIAALRGYTFRHRLQGESTNDWKLLFQRGDSGDLALVTWGTDTRSPAAYRTPTVRKLTTTDGDYLPLLHLASIRFAPGPFAVSDKKGVVLDVTTINPGVIPASSQFDWTNGGLRAIEWGTDVVNLAPGKSRKNNIVLSLSPEQVAGAEIHTPLEWEDMSLPRLAPITVERTNPIFMSTAPYREKLRVFVDAPAGGPIHGTLIGTKIERDPGGESSSEIDIDIPAGATHTEALLPLPGEGGMFRVFLKTTYSDDMFPSIPLEGLLPFDKFHSSVTSATSFRRTDFVENAPLATKSPLRIININAADAPANTALVFPYHFNPGWDYSELTPDAILANVPDRLPTALPARVAALVLWVRDDGSGNALRSRLRDATGQYFQPDLGRLDKKGWRLVTIPLSSAGLSKEAHWGGANDGVPHYPLVWDSLLLVDSANRTTPISGEILLAAPYYVVDGVKM